MKYRHLAFRQMKLTSLDLNLLVALRALLEEQHVSRAAKRVGLTQPAMSNALGRLRRLFDDQLLVRTPNGMQLTPRALALAGPLEAALDHLESALGGEGSLPKRRDAALRWPWPTIPPWWCCRR